MADIFISYSKADRKWAEALAAHLEAEGYSVWWDTQLVAGDLFPDVIQRAIAEARAVLVMWSAASAKSNWVRAEASYALQRNKLVPFVVGDFNPADIPLPFGELHTERFASLDRDSFAAVLERVSKLIGRTAGERVAETSQETTGEPKETREGPLVFVSHVDTDKPRIKIFVERLLEHGLHVFVDKPAKLGLDKKWVGSAQLHYIRYYENYRSAISNALNRSGCVLVFWSFDSIDTDRQIFWDEIEHGSINGFLVSTMIDDVVSGKKKMPKGFGFSQAHIADLTSEDAVNVDFEWVVADVEKLLAQYGKKLNLATDGA